MIDPTMVLGPADLGRAGVNSPAADVLNGAFTGPFATMDPNAMQPLPQYLGATAIPSLSQPSTVVSPALVSPTIFGIGGPISIMGTPDSIGPASALSGQSTAGDSGVLSGMGVGQTIAPSDASVAAPAVSDAGSSAPAAPTGGS